MAAMRAREPSLIEDEPPVRQPMISVRAGQSLLVRVGAVDRVSGVGEIVTHCRSCENHELETVGRWSPGASQPGTGNYYPVLLTIPANSPTVVWELHRIVLCDRQGNRRAYEAGVDFEEILLQVIEQPGVDSTPPRLLGVRVSEA
jgi:hypothetical protein